MEQRDIIYPGRLKRGDTIGIVAPAGPFEREKFERGVALLEGMGFRVRMPEGIFARDGYLAGSDEERAELVNRLFADDGVDGLMCARGGYGCLRLLDRLDYDAIRAHPKLLVGFSDISALLATLWQRCGLVGLHGPVVTSLGMADERSRTALWEGLTGTVPVAMDFAADGVVVQGGRASGTLVGGNLATLCHLLGTPFGPAFRDCILVLEDTCEPGYKLDRMLTQMRLAGCFDGLRGLLLGDFDGCEDLPRFYGVVAELFAGTRIPILAGLPVGHGQTNLAFPIGIRATVDSDLHRVEFERAGTRG